MKIIIFRYGPRAGLDGILFNEQDLKTAVSYLDELDKKSFSMNALQELIGERCYVLKYRG